jgi:hypothetical protein
MNEYDVMALKNGYIVHRRDQVAKDEATARADAIAFFKRYRVEYDIIKIVSGRE